LIFFSEVRFCSRRSPFPRTNLAFVALQTRLGASRFEIRSAGPSTPRSPGLPEAGTRTANSHGLYRPPQPQASLVGGKSLLRSAIVPRQVRSRSRSRSWPYGSPSRVSSVIDVDALFPAGVGDHRGDPSSNPRRPCEHDRLQWTRPRVAGRIE
jgi:hypothetical protein